MANSYVEYTTAGSGTNGLSQTIFTAPTKFLSINDIRIKGYNGSTWTELTISARGTTTVTLSAAPTAYSKIRVFRSSTTEALIDFQNGSRLAESDLDTAYQQGLFVAQEVAEVADPEGGSGIGNVVNSQLAGGITNDKLAGGISQDKLAGGITNAQLAGSIADSKLASGVGTSANNLVKLDGTAKLPAVDGSQLTNVGGITEYDIWRITLNTDNTTSAYISSNWERCDDAGFEKIGTGLSESSGVFSFPSTGKYLINAFVTIQARNGTVGQGQTYIYTTTDNSSYTTPAQAEMSGSSDHVITVSMSLLFNVTNISTHKIQLGLYTASNNLRALGSSTGNRTYITAMKIA